MNDRPSTFVLVHGTGHGGWCWYPTARVLRAGGHDVYCPSLTGLGDRSHLAGAAITAETHVVDIVNLLEFEDLHDVVLVGHSTAGVLVQIVADRCPERVAHVVLLNGLVPLRRWLVIDLLPAHARAFWLEHNQGGMLQPPPTATVYGITDPAQAAWVERRLTAHPYATLQMSWSGDGAFEGDRTYIRASTEPGMDVQRTRAEQDGWTVVTLDADAHDVMLTAPHEVAGALANLPRRGDSTC